ncbi:MAG: thioredoxin family protein [Candidatus Eiseniibacteriota bacterium]
MIPGGTRWWVVGLLAVAVTAGAEEAPRALAIGKAAPMADLRMVGVDGKSVSIIDAKGTKGTLVVFTCNSCPWVKAWESRIAELGNTYAKQGIGVIAINANDPKAKPEDDMPAMQARAKALGLAFPYVMDATSDVARAFGATRTPEAFLFDAAGKLVYHGAVDDNAHKPDQVSARWLNDALAATVGGKAVATRETKSLGCTIKFRTRPTSS